MQLFDSNNPLSPILANPNGKFEDVKVDSQQNIVRFTSCTLPAALQRRQNVYHGLFILHVPGELFPFHLPSLNKVSNS
jgi:hypothetical protein